MKHLKKKDKNFRKSYKNFEYKKLYHKFLFINILNKPNISKKTKQQIYMHFLIKNKNYHTLTTKITRRCIITNRGRGISQKFQISRTLLRKYLGFGIFPGYQKAVW